MMKKIVVLIVLLVLAGFSCNDCEVTKPKHKPVDWEGYNDVHTVYWNFTGKCSDFKTLGKTGQTIKMYGKICNYQNASPHEFYLRGNSSFTEVDNAEDIRVGILCFNNSELAAIQAKFDNSDLTKTCYVTGELAIMDYQDTGRCCTTEVKIFIESADDIYFE